MGLKEVTPGLGHERAARVCGPKCNECERIVYEGREFTETGKEK